MTRQQRSLPHSSARFLPALVALASLSALTACDTGGGEAEPMDGTGANATDTTMAGRTMADTAGERFTARLAAINDQLTEDTPSGNVRMEIRGDSLVIEVMAEGLPPDMAHLQHFHGFQDGSPATCAGMDADANNDGIVDVVETEATSGVTMVPFHDDPASMEIQAETYPRADSAGSYRYRQAVPLDSLRSAFSEKFGGDLALDQRVVYIHGVPQDADLPASAQSVLGVPAHVTVPIACGALDGGA